MLCNELHFNKVAIMTCHNGNYLFMWVVNQAFPVFLPENSLTVLISTHYTPSLPSFFSGSETYSKLLNCYLQSNVQNYVTFSCWD